MHTPTPWTLKLSLLAVVALAANAPAEPRYGVERLVGSASPRTAAELSAAASSRPSILGKRKTGIYSASGVSVAYEAPSEVPPGDGLVPSVSRATAPVTVDVAVSPAPPIKTVQAAPVAPEISLEQEMKRIREALDQSSKPGWFSTRSLDDEIGAVGATAGTQGQPGSPGTDRLVGTIYDERGATTISQRLRAAKSRSAGRRSGGFSSSTGGGSLQASLLFNSRARGTTPLAKRSYRYVAKSDWGLDSAKDVAPVSLVARAVAGSTAGETRAAFALRTLQPDEKRHFPGYQESTIREGARSEGSRHSTDGRHSAGFQESVINPFRAGRSSGDTSATGAMAVGQKVALGGGASPSFGASGALPLGGSALPGVPAPNRFQGEYDIFRGTPPAVGGSSDVFKPVGSGY